MYRITRQETNAKIIIPELLQCMLSHDTYILEQLFIIPSSFCNKQVTMERNELQDENDVLRNEILELQNELATRPAGNPGWGHATAGSPHAASTVFPSHQPMQPSTIASAVFPLQQPLQQTTILEHPYAPPPPPRELNLFPDAASDIEGLEPSEDQEAANHIARPLARYPTQSALWPVSLGLPRMEDEQCSSGTTGSSKEGSSSASSRD